MKRHTMNTSNQIYSPDAAEANTMENFVRDCDIAAARVIRKHGHVSAPELADLIRYELIGMGHVEFI